MRIPHDKRTTSVALLCLGLVAPLTLAKRFVTVDAAGEAPSYSSVGCSRRPATVSVVRSCRWATPSTSGVRSPRPSTPTGASGSTGGTSTPSMPPPAHPLRPRADADNAVYNIRIAGDALYVGGVFTSIGGTCRARLSALDARTGAVRPALSADTNGNVYNLSLAAGKLEVDGCSTARREQPWGWNSPGSPATSTTCRSLPTDGR